MKTTRSTNFVVAAAAAALLSIPAAARASAGSGADAALAAQSYAKAFSAGDLAAVWSALPQSWRTSVSEAAKTLGAKAKSNPETWNAARNSLSEIAATVAKKSGFAADFISRNGFPAAANAVGEDGSCPALVRTAARIGAAAKAATPEAMAGGDVGAILAAAPLALPGVTDKIPAFSESEVPEFSFKENADGSVTVGIPGASASKTVKMVCTEGAWVPAALADVFAGSGSWKQSVSSLDLGGNSGAAIVSALGMLRKTAANTGNAGTQQQFDQAAGTAAFPLLMLGSAASGGASAAQGVDIGAAADLLQGLLGK